MPSRRTNIGEAGRITSGPTAPRLRSRHREDTANKPAQRESNLLDDGAHFYGGYETADHKYVAIDSIEPQFYAKLIELTGADPIQFTEPFNSRRWSECKAKLAAIFKTKTSAQWCRIMEGTDVCFAPVLTLEEAQDTIQNNCLIIGSKLRHFEISHCYHSLTSCWKRVHFVCLGRRCRRFESCHPDHKMRILPR